MRYSRLWTIATVATVAAVIFFVGTGTVLAQVGTAGIRGLVQDGTGAVIPGVEVTIMNTGTGIQRVLVTNEVGLYVAPGLPVGNYDVTAQLPGFQTFISRGVVLTVGAEVAVDVVLQVGEFAQTIEVTAAAAQVQTTQSDISELVSEETMVELPLNGRNYVSLALLQPGVISSQQASAAGGTSSRTLGAGLRFNVNGSRFEDNSFSLDGQNTQDFFNGAPASAGGETMGVDALQEFEVKTANYSAEYSKASGGVVSAVTKSGTNEMHGSAFWFLRNDNLDAANFFDNAFGNAKPEFRRNQFGATMGGPIVQNKTFFFGAYEGIRQAFGKTERLIVPTQDAIDGLVDGVQHDIHPWSQRYIDAGFWPNRPNGRILSGGRGEFFTTHTDIQRNDYMLVKIDHQFNDNTSLSFRYTMDDGKLEAPNGTLTTLIDDVRNQFANLQLQQIFSPQVLNTLRGGFNRSFPDYNQTELDSPAELHINTRGVQGPVYTGMTHIGTDRPRPRGFAFNLFDVSDTLSLTMGRHALKIGGNYERHHYNTSSNDVSPGEARFSNWADFLTGRLNRTTSALNTADVNRSYRQHLVGLFIQDDWRVTNTLTINAGLRWETLTAPTENHGRISNLRDFFDSSLSTDETVFKNKTKLNFAPRLGIAWDIFGDGSTALRVAGGVFYPHILGNTYRKAGTFNPPYGGVPTYYGVAGNLPPGILPVGWPFSPTIFDNQPPGDAAAEHFPFDHAQPRVYQWNMSLQRQLPGGMIANAAYVGTRGNHLVGNITGGGSTGANTPYASAVIDGIEYREPGLPRRNPHFGPIGVVTFYGESYYHGLTLSLRGQMQNGLQFQLAHTYGHSIDTGSGAWQAGWQTGVDVVNLWDTTKERGSSNFDVRQNFTGNLLYDLPVMADAGGLVRGLMGGWQLSGIVALRTGNPFQVDYDESGDRNRDLSSRDGRPNLVPGANPNPVTGDPMRWFDVSSFALPEPGFYGNLGRNTLRADGFTNVDMALKKLFPVSEGFNVQFRAEFFNVLNHANFATPGGSQREIWRTRRSRLNEDAGLITGTVNTARQIQFGLKLLW